MTMEPPPKSRRISGNGLLFFAFLLGQAPRFEGTDSTYNSLSNGNPATRTVFGSFNCVRVAIQTLLVTSRAPTMIESKNRDLDEELFRQGSWGAS